MTDRRTHRPLFHYSHQPLGPLESCVQSATISAYQKPCGLWVSAGDGDDGWRAWCEAERFGLDKLTHVHEVILGADAQVLRICSEAALLAFARRYAAEHPRMFGQRGVN